MNIDHLSDLPDWDDKLRQMSDDDDGEWLPGTTGLACKALYEQWQAITFLLNGIVLPVIEKDPATQAFETDVARSILGECHLVGGKIVKSEVGGLYIIRMANAAVIREYARGITASLLLMVEENAEHRKYAAVITEEMEKFRQLFIAWVATFERDDVKDDWELFV